MHAAPITDADFAYESLASGVELAVDRLPQRDTVAMCFRVLTGVVDDPPELTGVSAIVERTLSKGTENYTGRKLADAFDLLGAEWGGVSGRQSTLLRVLCLPEFTLDVVDLMAEMLCRPTFPQDACRVAVQLVTEELKHLEDDPQDLLRVDIQRLALGDVLGRHPGGEVETLPRITPEAVREHWERNYGAARLQVAAAGPVEADRLAKRIDERFVGFGNERVGGRTDVDFTHTPGRHHRAKGLQQQYIGLTMPGAAKHDPRYSTERVLLGVLSGGMSGRLFTEVREKLGLVYWVGAWSEQPRDRGVIHLGASTTPENCRKTYDTLLRELARLSEDLTDDEVRRARDGLIAHLETEDDLTRARAAALSDDLFHFSRPIGLSAKLDAIGAVSTADVEGYAAALSVDQLCVATVGPREL